MARCMLARRQKGGWKRKSGYRSWEENSAEADGPSTVRREAPSVIRQTEARFQKTLKQNAFSRFALRLYNAEKTATKTAASYVTSRSLSRWTRC